MKEPAWLSIEAVLAFHEELVAEHGGSSFLRDRGLLESALASPRNHFAYGERDLFVLATVYANSITRNHPFGDGNKRVAFIAAYTFLGVNGLELQAPEAEVVRVVEGLSARTMSEAEFTAWLRRSCTLQADEKSTRRAKPRKNAPRNPRRHP
ncbi:MAG: type II toxin-antitoxin system death-on-curing family toxin [Phycisphaerales bacterium]|nr:MAG: type II toxin-antitoxin system death-on-curing family toxin [Phycisphaerales bacterium]